MVYGELGITHLLLHAQSRMIVFWSKINIRICWQVNCVQG